jgi:hypothetical protein
MMFDRKEPMDPRPEYTSVRYTRVDRQNEVPPPDERLLDVALLDMNHRWPNMGHDAIVGVILDAVAGLAPQLDEHGLGFRVLSFDVRAGLAVPERAGGRFLLYVGTGGPGHIDPRRNDGQSAFSQGIAEDPSWEPRVFEVFDSIQSEQEAALIAVCHTFGVMCRWAGAAEPVLRSETKGGKSSGLVNNILSPAAAEHPWLVRFAEELPDRSRFTVIDNRLFDLVPSNGRHGLQLAHESIDDLPGEAVTMIELARDRGGVVPRIFGVNHHPEVVDRTHALRVLQRMLERGDVTPEWYQERADTLSHHIPGVDLEAMLRLTSQFTLLFPLQFHLTRILRLRMEQLGLPVAFSEHDFVERLMEHARRRVRV